MQRAELLWRSSFLRLGAGLVSLLTLPILASGQNAFPVLPYSSSKVEQPIPQSPAKLLPISLDTVLRLAHDQNGQMAVARNVFRKPLLNRTLPVNNGCRS